MVGMTCDAAGANNPSVKAIEGGGFRGSTTGPWLLSPFVGVVVFEATEIPSLGEQTTKNLSFLTQ